MDDAGKLGADGGPVDAVTEFDSLEGGFYRHAGPEGKGSSGFNLWLTIVALNRGLPGEYANMYEISNTICPKVVKQSKCI